MNPVLAALALPSATHLGQKLSKKSFYERGGLSASQQSLLKEQVAGLEWLAQLKPDNTNIPAYRSEKHEYLEIAVISLQLKPYPNSLSESQLDTLHQMLHKAIPYPLILLIEQGEQTQLSLAEKSIHQADAAAQKLVLGEWLKTPWLQAQALDEPAQRFMASLAFAQLNHSHLYQLYQSLFHRFTQYALAQHTGQYASDAPAPHQSIEQLRQIQTLKKDISALTQRLAKTVAFNQKVEINTQIKAKKDALECLLNATKKTLTGAHR
jgi:hypothetical protein